MKAQLTRNASGELVVLVMLVEVSALSAIENAAAPGPYVFGSSRDQTHRVLAVLLLDRNSVPPAVGAQHWDATWSEPPDRA